ncbi:hypothetical protein [Nocardia sp. N2S4-5]|uniref:hypothetical protein n=1 Tax=Nocardia sp. N2S4-5 TaxID=3351565 RepID=UPI0037D76034
MPAFVDTQPNRLADRLLSDRHPVPLSVLLHLAPGALIVAAYLLIGEPLVDAIDYPHFAGWAIALCTVLLPILAGLLWLGYRRNGRLALRGVLHYTRRPVPRGTLVAMVVPLILWMITLGYALAPVNTFFLD